MGPERFRLFRPSDLLLVPLFLLIILVSGRGEGTGSDTVAVYGPEGELGLSFWEDTVLTVEGVLGPLTIQIEGGSVRISDSPCPGQNCVKQGWVSSPGIPLVCIPSGVYVLLEPPEGEVGGVDAVSY